jgi:hypothetical protein
MQVLVPKDFTNFLQASKLVASGTRCTHGHHQLLFHKLLSALPLTSFATDARPKNSRITSCLRTISILIMVWLISTMRLNKFQDILNSCLKIVLTPCKNKCFKFFLDTNVSTTRKTEGVNMVRRCEIGKH